MQVNRNEDAAGDSEPIDGTHTGKDYLEPLFDFEAGQQGELVDELVHRQQTHARYHFGGVRIQTAHQGLDGLHVL